MFLLAHLAAGYLLGRAWNLTFRKHQINVWLATFGGILPDLIDKPLALLPQIQGGRALAHSLLFLVLLGAGIRLHRAFLPLMLGVATHLLLDDPTLYLASFAWPFLGTEFTPDETMTKETIHRHLTKPRTGITEIVGGLVLLTVGIEHAWSAMRRRRLVKALGIRQVGRPVHTKGFDESAWAAPTDAE